MDDSLRAKGESRGSWRRVLLWGSLSGALIIVAASLWLSDVLPWFRAEPQTVRIEKPRPALRRPPDPLLAIAPAELPAAVRERYRLRPDRRLLLAVAEVQRLRKGTAPEPVTAEFQNAKWRILSGDAEVGTLSEFPSFEEATDLLARWAARTQVPAVAAQATARDTAALDRAVLQVDAAGLLAALSSLGSPADVQRDAARTRSTVSGLAWLSTLTLDTLDQADPLLAEAWSWLALERGSAARNAASEALIARALGYEAAAAQASAKLAADDPVRLYATGDEPHLGALCAKRPSDRPCHFLHLSLLAQRDQASAPASAHV